MRKALGLVGVVGILLLLPFLVQGQEPAAGQLIRLQTATFDPLRDGEPGATQPGPAAMETGPYYLVQFNGPIESTWIRQLEQLGAEPLGYVPDNTSIMRVQPEDVDRVRSMYAVRWMGPYRPDYRVAPTLAQRARAATAASETVDLRVVAFPGESVAALRTFLRGQGATVAQVTQTDLGAIFRITVSTAAVPQIAGYPGVTWIEPYFTPQVANAEGRRVMSAEAIWENRRFFGAGQIVAVSDSGLSVQGALNADFAGRLRRAFAPSEMNLASAACQAKTDWTDTNGHGTHVAGSVLGNGVNSGSDPANHRYTGSHAGVAPEAELVFMALNTDGSTGIQCIDDNGDFIARGYQEGARISSNSWGGPTGFSQGQPEFGGYDILSSIVDNFIWNNKDYLVLFAAGNAGSDADTIGSPGTAKNVLTVGASQNNRPNVTFNGIPESFDPAQVIGFSSRGPTDDGRVKPEIVAPGTSVLSVRAEQAAPETVDFFDLFRPAPDNANYAYSRGTSMATPLTAGAAALVREWVGKEMEITNPSAALLKALMIHGAVQLPGTAMPNTNSGWGRVDLKNTIDAQYAVFDDHVQGLVAGNTVTYTLQVLGATTAGTLFVPGPLLQSAGDTPPEAFFTLSATVPTQTTATTGDAGAFSTQGIAGFEQAAADAPIRDANGAGKTNLSPRPGRSFAQPEQITSSAAFERVDNGPSTQSYLQDMVGGGDFEDPAWTQRWAEIWLGYGIPLRTDGSDGGEVIAGNYSVWLGGSPSNDSIWYPLTFPNQIDDDFPSELSFLLKMRNLDPGFDSFCAAIVDASGYVIAGIEDCTDDLTPGVVFEFSWEFTPAEKAALRGQTGYLVLGTFGDGALPHMSAFVDNIALDIDFPDVTLDALPSAGPTGTTFLLSGSYNVPYEGVDVCVETCDVAGNYINTFYADARGDVLFYLLSSPTQSVPGTYTIETLNAAGRTATTQITLLAEADPTVQVTPSSGTAGTTFAFTGSGFVPNDTSIEVQINGQGLGVTGSDADGAVSFSLTTSSNTPPGSYTVQLTDSAGRSATTTFTVTAVPNDQPAMVVTPPSGPAGTEFTFVGSNFTPGVDVSFSLDGQALGSLPADAAGAFTVRLVTSDEISPGTYTLLATQGNNQASAQFAITGGDDGGTTPSGRGVHITLVWTDPPAQTSAGSALVNDLDLRLEGPGGPFFPNGGTSPDTRNTVETIRLENPSPGTYTVVVTAQRVVPTFGSQPYALVATTRQNYGTNTTQVSGIGGSATYLPLMQR